jgi:hypothetical protein
VEAQERFPYVSQVRTPQVGLAAAWLAQGDKEAAQQNVEPLLRPWPIRELEGADDPARIRLVCAQVLHASQDERAAPFLQQMYERLLNQADALESPQRKQLFLENVPAHVQLRELCHAVSTPTSLNSYRVIKGR